MQNLSFLCVFASCDSFELFISGLYVMNAQISLELDEICWINDATTSVFLFKMYFDHPSLIWLVNLVSVKNMISYTTR